MFSVDPNMMQRGGMGPGPQQQPAAPVQSQPKAPVLQQHAAVAQNYGLPQPKAPPPKYAGPALTGPQNFWTQQQWDEYHRRQGQNPQDVYNQGQRDAWQQTHPAGMDAYGRPTDPNAPIAAQVNPYGAGNAAAMAHAKAQAINDPNSFEYFYAKQWGDPRQNATHGWKEGQGAGGNSALGNAQGQNYYSDLAAQQWQARAGDRGGFNLDPFSGHFNVGPTSYGQAPERGSPEDIAAAMAYFKQQRAQQAAQKQWDAFGGAGYTRPVAPGNPYDNYGGR